MFYDLATPLDSTANRKVLHYKHYYLAIFYYIIANDFSKFGYNRIQTQKSFNIYFVCLMTAPRSMQYLRLAGILQSCILRYSFSTIEICIR